MTPAISSPDPSRCGFTSTLSALIVHTWSPSRGVRSFETATRSPECSPAPASSSSSISINHVGFVPNSSSSVSTRVCSSSGSNLVSPSFFSTGAQLDVLRNVTDYAGFKIVLVATSRGLDASGELLGRTEEVFLRRYAAQGPDRQRDLKAFARLVRRFMDLVPESARFSPTSEQLRLLNEATLGCVGHLAKWFLRALERCIACGERPTLYATLVSIPLPTSLASVRPVRQAWIDALAASGLSPESTRPRLRRPCPLIA